jgi:hypothetical protein
VTPGYDTSTPVVLPAQSCEVRANMTYDTGSHPTPAATANPTEPEGDEPIVVIKPS